MTDDDPDRLPDLGIDLSQPSVSDGDGHSQDYPWVARFEEMDATARELLEHDRGRYGRALDGPTREDVKWWSAAFIRWCDTYRQPIPPSVHRLLFHCLGLQEGKRPSEIDRMEGQPAGVAPESRSAFQKAVMAQAVDANASINSIAKAAEVERSTVRRWMKTPDWEWSVTWERMKRRTTY